MTTPQGQQAENRSQFDYLLNAFEAAAQSKRPFDAGYASKRQALFAYVRALERPASSAQANVPSDGELWSFMRRVLEHGSAIQQDYAAGNHKGGYEEYSARVDMAARTRAEELEKLLSRATQRKEG